MVALPSTGVMKVLVTSFSASAGCSSLFYDMIFCCITITSFPVVDISRVPLRSPKHQISVHRHFSLIMSSSGSGGHRGGKGGGNGGGGRRGRGSSGNVDRGRGRGRGRW
jgi:hypothetical protein